MIKASSTGSRLGLALRRLVGNDKAKHVDAGLRDTDLSLTEEGKNVVLETLAETADVAKALTAEAEAILEEQEKNDCK